MPKRSTLRRVPRYPLVFPVSYQREGSAAGPMRPGHTCNLSVAGACLVLGERLPPTTRINLSVQTDQERLTLTASVVWVESFAAPGEGLWHGVMLTPNTLDQQHSLQRVIRRHARVWSPTRVQLTLPARCLSSIAADCPLTGWTADLSRNGLALDLPRRLPIGTSIFVTLAAPRGEVTAAATVVWAEPSDPGPTDRCLRHGLQFLNPGSVPNLLSDFRIRSTPDLDSRNAESTIAAA